MKKLNVVLVVMALTGCVASEAELAQQGNWQQIGYQDGVAGHSQRSYELLSELGSVKQADYELGYTQGVKEYCNPNFAYQMGLSGQFYEGVCEGTDDAQKFRMEWQRGWNEFTN